MNKLFTVTVMTMLLCQTAWAENNDNPEANYKITTLEAVGLVETKRVMVYVAKDRQYYLDKCDEYLKLEQFYGEHPNSALELRTQYAQLAQAYCLRASLEK